MIQNQNLKIILEGINLVDTRNIAQVMRTSPLLADEFGYRRYTTVISAAWGNHRDFPWSKNMVDFEPSKLDQAMNKYRVWARLMLLSLSQEFSTAGTLDAPYFSYFGTLFMSADGCGYLHPRDIPHRLFIVNKYFDPAEVMTIWEDDK